MMTKDDRLLVTVSAPSGFANALLNGSNGVIVHRFRGFQAADLVFLLDGPDAGREWQFDPDHLVTASC